MFEINPFPEGDNDTESVPSHSAGHPRAPDSDKRTGLVMCREDDGSQSQGMDTRVIFSTGNVDYWENIRLH